MVATLTGVPQNNSWHWCLLDGLLNPHEMVINIQIFSQLLQNLAIFLFADVIKMGCLHFYDCICLQSDEALQVQENILESTLNLLAIISDGYIL